MTTFLTSFSILSFRNDIIVNSVNVDSFNLSQNLKNSAEAYGTERKNYANSRQFRNKYTQKLKDNLKELEQLFTNHRCVHIQWEVHEPLLLFFNSGAIVTLQLDEAKSNIDKIVIDSSLCGKLASDHITDVAFCENCTFISYTEPKFTYIYYSKQSLSNKLLGSKKNKVVGFAPQINTIDLPGPSNKRFDKKLSINNLKDCILVWWRFTNADVWPWMPVNHNIDHVNFFVYVLNGNAIDILCSMKVHGELQHARFSRWHSNHILTIEEVNEGNQCTVNVCTYEVSHGRCQCTSLYKLPLSSHITAYDWSNSEDKLLLSDEEMTLLIYDLRTNTTLVTSTQFMIKEITWHPDSIIACVLGTDGNLQCFDTALTQLKLQMSSENLIAQSSINLQSIIHPHKIADKVIWQNSNRKQNICSATAAITGLSESLLIYFEAGLLVSVNFSFGCITKNLLNPSELASQYLKCDSVNECVCLLQCLNWSLQSELCFQCLSKISNFLLRKPLNLKVESAIQLCLGTFYDSVSTLPETVICDYHQQIDHIARRFFHRLLRYRRFEKAYLLAINLQSRDLFLDLHHVAKASGETVLGIVAFKHAEQLDVSESSSCEETNSSCEDEESSCELNKIDRLKNIPIVATANPSNYKQYSNIYNKQMSLNAKLSVSDSTFMMETRNAFTSHQNISIADQYRRNYTEVNSTAYSKCFFKNRTLNEYENYLTTEHKDDLPLIAGSESSVTSVDVLKYMNKQGAHQIAIVEQTNKQLVENEDEEDLEGTRVKFVHFGIV